MHRDNVGTAWIAHKVVKKVLNVQPAAMSRQGFSDDQREHAQALIIPAIPR